MRAQDYALNSQIRTLLIQRWVDLSCLDFGVTNGVAYFQGVLRHHLTRANMNRDGRTEMEEVELAKNVERLVRQMRGIRDVVFRLSNMTKRGSKWTHR